MNSQQPIKQPPTGLGIIFTLNPRLNQFRYEQQKRKQATTQAAAQYQAYEAANKKIAEKQKEQAELLERYNQGKLTYNDLKAAPIYQEVLSKYGPDIGQDILIVELMNYREKYRPLSKEEMLTRGSAVQQLQQKFKLLYGSPRGPKATPPYTSPYRRITPSTIGDLLF